MLFPMCDDLKREFYSACPVWYWPVLWWQFMLMERYLGDLYTASGRAKMTYGLSLGPRGQLRLVFLSDAACHIAEGRATPVPAYHKAYPVKLTALSADHARRQTHAGEGVRLSQKVCAAAASPQLYLDPG